MSQFVKTSITSLLKVFRLAPTADSTTAIQFTRADGVTAVINVDTTNNKLVAATSSYETLITADNDIPNKKYVDLNAGINGSGWIPSNETWTYASADSPTFALTVPTDKTSKYSKGMKLQLQQSQALTNYWSFDVDNSDAISGTVMINIGTPTYTAGKFSNALTLNGTSQALKCANNTFQPTGDFTVGCWVKLTNATNLVGLFQSYSNNTSHLSGFQILIAATTGVINWYIAKGTGVTINVDYTLLTGATNVADNTWHCLVFTYRNNWAQIYVDGQLDSSGYSLPLPNPYSYTTFTRIGVNTSDGTTYGSTYIPGQIDDLFLINGYALDEKTIHDKYVAATAQGISAITLTKNFLITDISYSNPNTTITLYGGTDFSLSNTVISNPYYSMIKCPYGFNFNPDKWSVILIDNVLRTQLTPINGTVYQLSPLTIVMPIGSWFINGGFNAYAAKAGSLAHAIFGLSTAASSANTISNKSMMTGFVYGSIDIGNKVTIELQETVTVKKTLYIIGYVTQDAIDEIDIYKSVVIIRSACL